MSEKEPQEIAAEVYKHELKAGEKMQLLTDEFGSQVVQEALYGAFERTADRVDDPQRLERIVLIAQQFGAQAQGNQMLEQVQAYARTRDELDVGQQPGGQ